MIAVPVGTGRDAEGERLVTLGSFAAGATAAGIALGLGLAFVGTIGTGSALPKLCLALAAAIASAYATSELFRLGWPLPQRHWQVPQHWGESGRSLYAGGFGAVLGAGFLTFIPYAGYYVVVLLTVALADWRWSVVVMIAFAWARVAPIIVLSERLRALPSSDHLQRAVVYSERVTRINTDLSFPRVALLIATAIACLRNLIW